MSGGSIYLRQERPQSVPINAFGPWQHIKRQRAPVICRLGIPEQQRSKAKIIRSNRLWIPEPLNPKPPQKCQSWLFGIPVHIYILPQVGAGRAVSIGRR